MFCANEEDDDDDDEDDNDDVMRPVISAFIGFKVGAAPSLAIGFIKMFGRDFEDDATSD